MKYTGAPIVVFVILGVIVIKRHFDSAAKAMQGIAKVVGLPNLCWTLVKD